MTETIKLFGHEPEMNTERAMRNAGSIKIFGRLPRSVEFWRGRCISVWEIGLLVFEITLNSNDTAYGRIGHRFISSAGLNIHCCGADTESKVAIELEEKARLFMRECLEMAGPMEAVARELYEPADVRYCYE